MDRLRAAVTDWPELLPGGPSSNGARAWLQDRVGGLLDPTEDCTCGYGGFHDDVNPQCYLNQTEGETDDH